MPNSSIPVTSGAGNNVDTRTTTTDGDHRQVIVVGDPSSDNAVAAVQATDPSSNVEGLVVRDVNTSALVAVFGGSGIKIRDIVTGTITIGGANGTISVFLPDTGHTLGKVDAGTGTFQVFLPDTGHEIGTIRGNTNTLTVFLPDTGHELGSIRGINSSINVYLGATAGTLIIKPDPAGTFFTNNANTASIFTITGSTAGVSVSGVTLVSPSASYNYKIFAYNLATTGSSQLMARFVNGAGAGQTELWRPLITPGSPTGANLAVTPPGHIFSTGTNTTLALLLDTGTLVHYSVSYIKESA